MQLRCQLFYSLVSQFLKVKLTNRIHLSSEWALEEQLLKHITTSSSLTDMLFGMFKASLSPCQRPKAMSMLMFKSKVHGHGHVHVHVPPAPPL